MKVIRISGIIASWEMENESNVTPASLRKSLDEAGQEELLITINSPGGSVFQGLEMFSMIVNHPAHTETRVVSLAASMGSVLALAGNKKSIEDTAMFFIHNAQGIGIGDHREMAKVTQWLKDINSVLAGLYEKHTTLTLAKAQKLMDDEAQFFGKDLVDLGFELIETGDDVNQPAARVQAVARLAECSNKISDEENLNDLEKVAASIADKKKPDNKKTGSDSNLNQKTNDNSTDDSQINPAADAGNNNTEERLMTLDEFMAKHPDIYAQAVQVGVSKEFDRANAHITLGRQAGALELAVKNIEEKAEFSLTVSAQYQAEGLKNNDIRNRADDDQGLDTSTAGADDAEINEADTEAYKNKLKTQMGGAA